MRPAMRARALTCLVAFLVGPGCSFTMPDAPDRPYRTMPDCETSRAKPVIDLLGAGTALSLALTFALVAAIEDSLDETGGGGGEAGTAALISLGAGGLFTVASIGGFRKASRCRAAQAEFQTMMYYGPPPAYPYPGPTQAPTQTQTKAPGQTPAPTQTPTPTQQPTPTQTQPPKSAVPVGAERGLCRSDGTCDRGLTCASGRCVFLPR
jgi:hypothetical protein